MGEVEWGPAVAFLAAGLVVGALILWRVVRTAPATSGPRPEDSLERRDLLARLDGLMNQLRELEDTGIKRTAVQHRDERFVLELQAARTLLALDARAAPSAGQGKKRADHEYVTNTRMALGRSIRIFVVVFVDSLAPAERLRDPVCEASRKAVSCLNLQLVSPPPTTSL